MTPKNFWGKPGRLLLCTLLALPLWGGLLTYEEAMKMARNHPALAAGKSGVEAATARLDAAGSSGPWSLGVEPLYSDYDGHGAETEYALSLEGEFRTPGLARWQERYHALLLRKAEGEALREANALKGEAAYRFRLACQAGERLELARKEAAWTGKITAAAQKRHDLGVGSEEELLRAGLEELRSRSRLEAREREREEALALLEWTLTASGPVEPVCSSLPVPAVFDGTYGTSLGASLLQIEGELERARLETERAERSGAVTAGVVYQKEWGRESAGVALSIPLNIGGRSRALDAAGKAEEARSGRLMSLTLEEGARKSEALARKIRGLDASLHTLETALANAGERSVEMARKRFLAGRSTIEELFDASRRVMELEERKLELAGELAAARHERDLLFGKEPTQ